MKWGRTAKSIRWASPSQGFEWTDEASGRVNAEGQMRHAGELSSEAAIQSDISCRSAESDDRSSQLRRRRGRRRLGGAASQRVAVSQLSDDGRLPAAGRWRCLGVPLHLLPIEARPTSRLKYYSPCLLARVTPGTNAGKA